MAGRVLLLRSCDLYRRSLKSSFNMIATITELSCFSCLPNLHCTLIVTGNEDEEADEEIRRFAVLSYIDLLEKPVLPDILVWVICWVSWILDYSNERIKLIKVKMRFD